MANDGPIQVPVTSTEIDSSFEKGFTLSAYEGTKVMDADTRVVSFIPTRPAPISYSDFINKVKYQKPYPLPIITFTKQPANKSAFFEDLTTTFTIDWTVDYQLNLWPENTPLPDEVLTFAQWETSTDNGATWSGTTGESNNGKTLTVSTVALNNGALFRAEVYVQVFAETLDDGLQNVASAQLYSNSAKLTLSEFVVTNPSISFTKQLYSPTIEILTDTGGSVTGPGSGFVRFSPFTTAAPYTVTWPTVPASRQGSQVVTWKWIYSPLGSSSWFDLISGVSLGPEVTVASEDRVDLTNLTNTSLGGYDFALQVLATQNLTNPVDTRTYELRSGIGRIFVEFVVQEAQAQILSLSSNGIVVDTLASAGPGPTFTLTTNRAIGKQITISSTNNSSQIGGDGFGPFPPGMLLPSQTISINANTMSFGLAASGGSGNLRQLAKWKSEGETLSISGLSGWQPGSDSASTGYTIANDQTAGQIEQAVTTVHEGENITGSAVATDVENGNWAWQLVGFTEGASASSFDVPADNGFFTVSWNGGTDENGRYVGAYSIPTHKDPGTPTSGQKITKKSGSVRVFDNSGNQIDESPITITEYESAVSAPAVFDVTQGNAGEDDVNTTFYIDGGSTGGNWGTIPASEQGDWVLSFGSTTIDVVTSGGVSGVTTSVTSGTTTGGAYYLRTQLFGVPFSNGKYIVPQDLEYYSYTTVTVRYVNNSSISTSFTLTQRIFLPARNPDGTPK